MSVRFEPPRSLPPPARAERPHKKPINIQDSFLFGSLKENQPLVIALESGKLIRGTIVRFDRYTILVDNGTQEILLFKHAISCIARSAAPEPAT